MRILLFAAAAPLAMALPVLAAPADNGLVGVTRAVVVAERAMVGRAFDAELETEGGRPIYEIELARKGTLHEARVDARTGRLVSATKPRMEGAWRSWFDAEKMRAAEQGRPLSTTLAALERQSKGRVQEVELEVENGRAWYDVEIATRAGIAEIRVDPRSGRRLAMGYDD